MGSVSRRRAFPRVAVAQDTAYQTDLSGSAFTTLHARCSGNYQTSGAGNPVLDTAFNFWGKVELSRGETNLLSMDAIDLRHLSALLSGEYAELQPTLSLPATTIGSKLQAVGEIDFQALMDNAAVDARNEKIVLSGRTRGLNRIGSTANGVSAEIHAYVDTIEIDKALGGRFFEPRYHQTIQPLEISENDQHVKKFAEPIVLAGVMFRVFDASLEFGNANIARSDALVRKLKMIHHDGDGEREVMNIRWPDLNMMNHTWFGMSTSRSGVGMWLFDDPTTPEVRENLLVLPNHHITVEIDTASTPDRIFTVDGAADTVVAAGDQLFMTWLAYRPIGFDRRLSNVGQS